MQHDDIACLQHILAATGKAISFVQGKSRKDLPPLMKDLEEVISTSEPSPSPEGEKS